MRFIRVYRAFRAPFRLPPDYKTLLTDGARA